VAPGAAETAARALKIKIEKNQTVPVLASAVWQMQYDFQVAALWRGFLIDQKATARPAMSEVWG